MMISIIIPTFNQAEYIDYTLKSVIKQSYENWECLIIDDGSNDNTEEIVERIIEKDSRLKYFKKANGGASSARNYGLDIAKGDLIQFLDSDDYIDKDKLSKGIEAFENNKSSNIIISNFNMFRNSIDTLLPPYCNLENRTFDFNSILIDWDVNYTIPLHCGLFQKSLFENVRFDESIQSKEDWIMWVTILKNGAKASFVNESLAFYRYNDKGNHTNDDNNFIKANKIVYNLIDEEDKIILFEKALKSLLKKSIELETSYKNYDILWNRKPKYKRIISKLLFFKKK